MTEYQNVNYTVVLRAISSASLNISREADFTTSLGSPCQSLIILPCEEILTNVQPKPSLMQLKAPQRAETVLCFSSVLVHRGYF